jgi:predicted RNase H-like nuclease (RuvC/YqgF family)
MVATDVPRIPHFVEKIGKTVNAKIYAPSRPIPVADKQELARELSDVRIRNAHERDALTAAVYAYRSMLSKFQQIEHKVREEQIAVDRSHLKALVLKGMSINEAISNLVREESKPVDIVLEPDVPEEELTRERFDAIHSKLDALRAENRLLEERTEDLERLVEFLRFRESELTHSLDIVAQKNHWEIKRDREVVKKKSELKRAQQDIEEHRKQLGSLRRRFAQLRGVKHLEMRGDMLAVKVLEKFTQESIEEYITKVATLKYGDIVLFEDASGGGPATAQMLIDRKIRAVIVDTPLSHLSMAELVNAIIPVIDAKEVELKRVDEFAFVNRKKFEQKFQEFMKRVQEQARMKGEDRLVAIVEKYRREIER